MIRRIELINYMSHRHTVIEPCEGLTVICGPNNCGKSAIVSALDILCRNVSADYAIRHGETTARIIIHTDTGNVVVWSRKRGSGSAYEIDGETFHRLNRAVPEKLHAVLRMPTVRTNREDVDVHLGQQKSPIFLIDSDSQAAAFFASSSDAERLLKMEALHKERTAARKREAERLSAQLRQLDAQIASLAPIDALAPQITAIEIEYDALHDGLKRQRDLQTLRDLWRREQRGRDRHFARAQATRPLRPPPELADERPLEEVVGKLRTIGRDARRLGARCNTLAPLKSPPAIENTQPLERRIAELRRAHATVTRAAAERNAIEPLREPPAMADTARLAADIAALRRAEIETTRLRRLRETGAKLASPPAMQETQTLEEAIAQLRRAAGGRERVSRLHDAVAGLRPPPELADPQPLQTLIGQLIPAARRVETIRNELADLRQAIDSVRQQVQAWAEANPTCPTCGGPVDAERLVAGGHAHV